MNKTFTTIATLSFAALIANTAIAAPNSQHNPQHTPQHNSQHSQQSTHKHNSQHSQQHNPQQQAQHSHKQQAQHANASPKWRAGQSLPSHYQASRYAVNDRQVRQLPRPGAQQHWYKVNGDYILVNSKNHKIIRVMS